MPCNIYVASWYSASSWDHISYANPTGTGTTNVCSDNNILHMNNMKSYSSRQYYSINEIDYIISEVFINQLSFKKLIKFNTHGTHRPILILLHISS